MKNLEEATSFILIENEYDFSNISLFRRLDKSFFCVCMYRNGEMKEE